MRLLDLEPQFVRYRVEARTVETETGPVTRDTQIHEPASALSFAHGVQFLCPLCFQLNGNQSKGVHSILCWSPGVPQTIVPGPGRWAMDGTSLEDLTLRAGSSSVQIASGCRAHFYVRDGAIEFC